MKAVNFNFMTQLDASFITIKRGKIPLSYMCDDLESGHNEIMSIVLKNTSYIFIFDVFDDDL